jgi:hypothetical protein
MGDETPLKYFQLPLFFDFVSSIDEKKICCTQSIFLILFQETKTVLLTRGMPIKIKEGT